MNASNVRAFSPPVNPSPEDVCTFLRQKAERGEIAANSARLKVTAVAALAGILAEDEPKTAAYLRDNVASIATRWATLNSAGATGDTAKTYESRTRSAIDDYFAWVANPKDFKFRRRDGVAKPEGKPRKVETPNSEAANPPPQQSAPSQASTANAPGLRDYQLGPDREPFRFVLPTGGIVVNDVRKIICHLLTLANDFDPGVPSHAQVFSIVASQRD
jgi:hypothetical protein